jgi:signal recognition particle subunit SRP54
MTKAEFNLSDFMSQVGQVSKLCPTWNKLLEMFPGAPDLLRHLNYSDLQRQFAHMWGIYDSMSAIERHDPDALDAGRRRRIATGAGVGVKEVQQFINQFQMSRRMCRQISRMDGE